MTITVKISWIALFGQRRGRETRGLAGVRPQHTLAQARASRRRCLQQRVQRVVCQQLGAAVERPHRQALARRLDVVGHCDDRRLQPPPQRRQEAASVEVLDDDVGLRVPRGTRCRQPRARGDDCHAVPLGAPDRDLALQPRRARVFREQQDLDRSRLSVECPRSALPASHHRAARSSPDARRSTKRCPRAGGSLRRPAAVADRAGDRDDPGAASAAVDETTTSTTSPSSSNLPNTGSDPRVLALLGMALLMSGIGLRLRAPDGRF